MNKQQQALQFKIIRNIVLLLMVFAAACEKKQHDGSEILATVENTSISQQQLENHINTRFKDAEKLLNDQAVRQKVLESLVASRAMSLLAEKEMPKEEINKINEQVAVYREELLAKYYLKQKAKPDPVSSASVKEYYDAHPEKFGASIIKVIEMLTLEPTANEEQRDLFLARAPQFTAGTDWKRESEKLSKQLPVTYKKFEAQSAMLEKELETAINKLSKNQVSNVFFAKQGITIVKVIDIKELPPKALSEVSQDIRKSLAPIQLKKSVALVSEQALKQVNVSYKNNTNQQE